MQRRAYTNEENKKIEDMQRRGLTYAQMASELGRSEKALWSHVYKTKKKTKVKTKHFRQTKVGAVEMVAKQNVEAAKSRPMFALVGERSEIAQTLRELFS